MKKFFLFLIGLIGFLNFAIADSCSLNSVGAKNYKDLYKNLKNPPVSNEDLGRYVGYGRRSFTGGIVYSILDFFGIKGCYSIYNDAKVLCKNFEESLDVSNVKQLKNNISNLIKQISPNSQGYKLLDKFLKDIDSLSGKKNLSVDLIKKKLSNDILNIKQYYQSRSIKFSNGVLYWPYKYLVPLNISYNRSLQNLSSYYTDIGFVWLVMWLLILLGFVYSIFTKNKFLFALTSANIFGFVVWWFVGSAILWYGIGIVIWTILSTSVFMYFLLRDLKQFRFVGYIVLIFFVVILFYQLFLNFIRISSQGGGGPFAWYKENVGEDYVIDDFLSAKKMIKQPYKRQDIFNLQFAHYNKFIKAANNRKKDENIILAGTYARYFINNQKGIFYDQMLENLWKWMSDWNVCKTYLRLKKDKKIAYIAIDPNIGTVTDFNGGGNKTLFDRFFGNINLDTWNLDEWGVLTFLGKLKQAGYVDYFYSNNLAAKYGFVLTDQQLKDYLKKFNPKFKNISDDDLAVLRGALVASRYPWVLKLTAKKFFNGQTYGLFNFVMLIAQDRINNLDFIDDLADVYGKNVDSNKLKQLVIVLFKGNQRLFLEGVKKLNQDERFVLANFLGIVQQLKNKKDYKALQDIVLKSITSSSQIFVARLK